MTNPSPPEDRLDRIERVLSDVATQQAANTSAIAQLTAANAGLREDIQSFIRTQETIIENGEHDRAVFQAEIRRIWEYLLQQGGNGSSPQ